MYKSKVSIWFWVVGLSILFFQHGNFWSAFWASKWALFVISCSMLLAFSVARKTSYFFLPLFLVVNWSGLYVGIWPDSPYMHLGAEVSTVFARQALYALITFWTLILAVGSLPPHYKHTVEKYLATVGLLSIAYTLLQWIMGNEPADRVAFYGNASMNGCLIACLYPFMKKCIPADLAVVLSGVAVWITHTSIPLGVLAITWFLATERKQNQGAFFAGLSLLALGFIYQKGMLFDGAQRFPVWYTVMGWWWKETNHWVGAGLGSGFQYIPVLQATIIGQREHFFMWLHNDWLQTVFELGFIGFASLFIAWFFLLMRSMYRPQLLASFVGFSACAVFDYPARLPIHAVCLMLVIWLILQREGSDLHG